MQRFLSAPYITGATVVLAGLALLLALSAKLLASPAAAPNQQEYIGTELDGVPSFDFRLADQTGKPIAPSDFKGRLVVVAFLAPECTDVCPLTASQLRMASESLKREGIEIELVAVNTNAQMAAQADVAAASAQWGVADMPNWHYVTGNPDELSRVWRAYNVYAGGKKEAKPTETEHSGGAYLLDRAGNQRWFMSVPYGIPGFRQVGELTVQHARSIASGR